MDLKRSERPAEAAEAFRAALAADPTRIDAHFALAWVLISLDDTAAAVAEFREVIRLAPASPEAEESGRARQRLGQ